MTITRHGRRLPAWAVLAILAPGLGGCFADREATGSLYPHDVRERHPITLTNAPRVLDIFIQGPSGIDGRQAGDLRAYMAEYRRFGSGPIVAQVPGGSGQGAAMRAALATIRESTGGNLSVRGYAPIDASVAAPIRLSFVRLQARVADRCGLWPQDLGMADAEFGYRNEPYWNLGCAVHANVAAQVADPLDLVRGRPETPPDTTRRMNNIGKTRDALDPSTLYRQDDKNKISTAIGN